MAHAAGAGHERWPGEAGAPRGAAWLEPQRFRDAGLMDQSPDGGRPRIGDQSTPKHAGLVAPGATPPARDWRSDRSRMTAAELYGSKGQPLARQSLYADSGQEPTGFIAETANGGQLSPAHSRWLMGLPPAWDDCAATVTRSSPRSRKHSSKP
jgi:hypothetical protein